MGEDFYALGGYTPQQIREMQQTAMLGARQDPVHNAGLQASAFYTGMLGAQSHQYSYEQIGNMMAVGQPGVRYEVPVMLSAPWCFWWKWEEWL